MQANNMKEKRIARNMSMKDLSFETGISERYLYFIERGDKNPSLKTAKRISNALNVRVDDIFFTKI